MPIRQINVRIRGIVVSAVILFGSVVVGATLDVSKLPPATTRRVDFNTDIKPLFETRCGECHGNAKQKGGFRLDRKSAALKGGDNHAPDIIPGNSVDSPLIHFVAELDPDMVMPREGKQLTREEVALLRAWIDQGAAWPEDKPVEQHWAFKSPVRAVPPKTKDSKWGRNPIDTFVLAKLEEKHLSPSREVDRPTLIRRVMFDLIGLPPSPEDVEEFVSDRNADAYEKLVDRLLASPRYGERWARHWLDVVRFAETTGYEVNVPRNNAWPYRDYVIRAFNEDKPYDRFIMEQLAGDTLGADEATGFIVGGPNDMVKSPDVVLTRQQRADELHDMVSTTGSAFLGLTVGCARCHNHKFDPVSQKDYYAMTAVFSGVQHGERELRPPDHEQRVAEARELRATIDDIEAKLTEFEPLANPGLRQSEVTNAPTNGKQTLKLRPQVHPRLNVDRFAPTQAKYIRFTVLETTGVEPCIDELEIYTAEPRPRNVALASAGAKATASSVYPNSPLHKLEHINDGLYGNSHSWISSESGKGWVQIELSEKVIINKVVWGRDREEKYADRLATNYKIEVATETNSWITVAGSNDRRPHVAGQKFNPTDLGEGLSDDAKARLNDLVTHRTNLETKIKQLTTVPMIYAGTFGTPEKTFRLQRGDPMQPKEPVAPGAIEGLAPQCDIPADASEKVRRLALARWIASNENPLTARVIVNRLWQHHFGEGIVNTPSDFGVNGSRPSHPELLDWLATELIRGGWKLKPIHRLMVLSSSYRQSSAANAKNAAVDAGNRLLWRYSPRRLEAEPIRDAILSVSGKLDLTMGGPGYQVFEPNDNYVRVYEPKKQFGAAEWRRMIYQFKPRMQQDATFGVFDCPDGGQIAPRRGSSTTPLQALNLLNSNFMMQQAQMFAERLQADCTEVPAQVRRAFLLAFNRAPTRVELSAAKKLIEKEGLPIFCRAILNANEFIYVF